MAIKEIPTNVKTYYKSLQDNYKAKKEEAILVKEELMSRITEEHKRISEDIQIYKDKFNVDLEDYKEFKDNKYINGSFLKVAKGMFINRNNDYELVSDLFSLYNLANLQKQVYDLDKDIEKCDKILTINLKDYTEILRVFYTEVHKKLILEGYGYAFSKDIGWICINRCVIRKQRPMLDYAATKKREAELKAKGARIYNKEEDDWCKRNGIEYVAEDKRVFRRDEYCYEIPLLDCKLPNGSKLKLELADYRHSSLRGKTNEELSELANNNPKEICELKLDIRTKLTLCDKIDKILYTKFIRNENQEPVATRKANRKN